MKNILKFITVFVLVLLSSCGGCGPTNSIPISDPSPNITPILNTTIPEQTDPNCVTLCALLHKLHCPAAKGSPGKDEVWGTVDDISCTLACTQVANAIKNTNDSLPFGCLMNATSCATIDAC